MSQAEKLEELISKSVIPDINDRLDEIFEEIELKPQSKQEKSKLKWEIKAALYEYSLNIPAFSLENYYSRLNGEFKGFWILKIDDKEMEDLKVYGLDKLKEFRKDKELDFIV